MKRIICSVVGIAVLLLGTAGFGMAGLAQAAGPQSLADLARKEQTRRKSVKRPTKVYTNEDANDSRPLTVTGAAPSSPAPAVTESSGQATEAGAEGAAPADGTAATPAAAKPAPGEAEWRNRMKTAREGLERAQMQLAAMRDRAAMLTAGGSASTASPEQQTALRLQQQSTFQEYDRLRADVERLNKALSDLQAEARAAGVPPGWLR